MNSKVCKVEDCGASAEWSARGRKGLCRIHYSRLITNGDPLCKVISPGDVTRFVDEVVVGFAGEECLRWPFSTNTSGYGQISVNGRPIGAHRHVCTIVHGPPPTSGHLATHSCGNGHLGCVNPSHLSWKTHLGNMADMVSHGTSTRGERHHNCKLTEIKVREILSLNGKETLGVLAKKFGVRKETISKIQKGERWSFLSAERTS